jgi:hypothetical protein
MKVWVAINNEENIVHIGKAEKKEKNHQHTT